MDSFDGRRSASWMEKQYRSESPATPARDWVNGAEESSDSPFPSLFLFFSFALSDLGALSDTGLQDRTRHRTEVEWKGMRWDALF